MVLKTIVAADLAGALARARRELGPDALVLATREVRGRRGLNSVEVTVGLKRERGAGRARPDELLVRLRREVASAPEVTAPEVPVPADAPGPPALDAAFESLLRSGLSRDLAERFVRIARRDLRPQPGADELARAAERGIAGIVRVDTRPLEARCLFVVGPPGSGKTTTSAKLAARYAGARRGRVTFAEADQERVGSYAQAELFSRHLGVGLSRVRGPADLERVLASAGRSGTVVVDTPGIGRRDADRLRFVRELRRAAPRSRVALLLPAGIHRDEARRIVDRFEVLSPSCVGISRVDDGSRVGELFDALSPREIPVSFVTSGHRVPLDIELATPRGLAGVLLGSSTGSGLEEKTS